MASDRHAIVSDDQGLRYRIVVLKDGTRIDAALYPHSIDIGRRVPVPAHHEEVADGE